MNSSTPTCLECGAKIKKEKLAQTTNGGYKHTQICDSGHVWESITYGGPLVTWTFVGDESKSI